MPDARVIPIDGERPGRRRRAAADGVAAGADRASGERARWRRRVTPLLEQADPDLHVAPPRRTPKKRPTAARRAAAKPAPSKRATSRQTPSKQATAKQATAKQATAKQAPGKQATGKQATAKQATAKQATAKRATAKRATAKRASPAPSATRPIEAGRPAEGRRDPGLDETGERIVAEAASVGRRIAKELPAGASPSEVERRVADALTFLRRRITGDYEVDEFGFDEHLTDAVLLNLLRPIYRHWFRVEVRGIENIPSAGGALVVANHSGTVAVDSLMTQVAIHDEHPMHRHLRLLGADLIFGTPVVGDLARKGGATLAGTYDAEQLLLAGHLVGVWPEGYKGVGKPFSERYKLQRFGRGGFVASALRTRTPIVPCAIVGAEEIYPMIGNMRMVARLLGVPYAPITPTWPLLGPLGLVPLPSKWLIEFGTPIATDEFAASGADDPMLVFDVTDQVRETIQQTLYSLLMQRRSVFF